MTPLEDQIRLLNGDIETWRSKVDEREQQISRLEDETIEKEKKYYDSIKQLKLDNEREMDTLKECVRDYETEITNLKQQWETSINCELEEEQEKWNVIVGELRDNLHQKNAAMDASEKELSGQKEAGLTAISKELTCRVVQLSLLEVEMEDEKQNVEVADTGELEMELNIIKV